MSKILIILLSIFLFPTSILAQDLSQLHIANHEKGSYRTLLKKSGKVIWQASWSINKINKNGKDIVNVTEKGSGKYNNSSENINWILESVFIIENNPLVLRTERTAFGLDGKELWRKNKILDHPKKILISEQYEAGKLKSKKMVSFPELSTYPSDILSCILRGYNFQTEDPLDFYIFSVEGKLFRIRARKIGREVVRVPAGEIDSYKIELSLDFGIVNIVAKHFLPKTYMWFSVNDPHVCVRYEGLESGIGSPYVVMELEKFEP